MTGEGGEDLIQNDSTFQTNVDRSLFEKLPLESTSSSVSSLVTLSTPGISADSNGLFHGLGDHAENSFSVDGQPITDQQSKVFSNQIPSESIQSMEVISGAPPAEYGDKTSVVIKVTTRSGQGVARPTGSITAGYGSFGSPSAGFDLAVGGPKWGNFIAASAMNSGRFLDGPEFSVFHDKGNQENIFDRVDYVFSPVNAMHLNLGYTRSWFQTPNSYDNLNVGSTSPITGEPVGANRPEIEDRYLQHRPHVYARHRSAIKSSTLAHLFARTATTTTRVRMRLRISRPVPSRKQLRNVVPYSTQAPGPTFLM